MQLTRKDPMTGISNTIELDITDFQLTQWEQGLGLIQDIFPNLNDDEREFIMTGLTADSWDALFAKAADEG
jgi:hypothetical protein